MTALAPSTTAEKANSHQMPEVSGVDKLSGCQTAPRDAAELELHIKDCGIQGMRAYARYEAHGDFADRGEADRFFLLQREAVALRSPATVRAMEKALGLA